MTELTAFVVGMLIFLFVGIRATRRVSVRDFENNSARTTCPQLVMSILASLLGGFMFFGVTALAFEAGVVAMLIGIGYSIGLLAMSALTPSVFLKMHGTNSPTLDSVIAAKFGPSVQAIVVLVNFTFFIAVLAAQFLVFNQVADSFGWQDYGVAAYLLFTFVVVIYSACSGYKGVLKTDQIQLVFVCISVVAILIHLIVPATSDWWEELPYSHFTGLAEGPLFLVGVLIFFPLTVLARTDIWQRIGSAPSPRVARRALIIVAMILPFFYFAFTAIGMFVASQESGTHPTKVFLDLILSTLNYGSTYNKLVGSILILGISAALVSTIDTNLNVVSVALGRMKERMTNRPASLIDYRVIVISIGTLGAIAPFFVEDLVNLIVSAATILLLILPLTILSIVGSSDVTHSIRLGASVGLAIGYVCCMYFLLFGDPKTAFLPSSVVVIAILGSTYALNRFRT